MRLIVKQGSLQLPRSKGVLRSRRLAQGEAVPAGVLPQAEVDRLIAAGVLSLELTDVPLGKLIPLPPTRGKWQHDPAALAGKTIDQLRAMALDTDSSLDVDDLSEASLVQLLTSDYHPAFHAAPKASASDRHRPGDDALRAARKGAAR